MYKEIFAKNLYYLKGDKTLDEIARDTGIPQQTLSRYLSAKSEIKIYNLCVLADYFDIDLDTLVGRKNI